MNAADGIRLPPHSTEAEQALLGALMMDSRAWDRIADIVAVDDFYRDDHRRIFRVVKALAESGQVADVITVHEAIERANEVEQVGGLGYLGELANSSPGAANVARYAAIVADRAKLRSLIAFADDVAAQAFGNCSAQECMDNAEAKLFALAQHTAARSEPRPVADILSHVVQKIQERFDNGGAISGLKTGLADLDDMLDGLKPGELIIMAGRPSMGKTALALDIAKNVALAGKPVLVFSLEMGDTQLVIRSLSSLCEIDGKALSGGRMNPEQWSKLTDTMGRLHHAPLIIDESPALTAGQMRARARRQARRGGLSLVVIDYLQLMRGQGNNRNEELGDITRNLKLMARDLDVPVLVLSQLSRKCEERTDKRPLLSDLRESGAIEQDADVVAMMYRDDYYNASSAYAGLAEVLIRKNRMGECGSIRLVFERQYSRFRNAHPGAIAEVERRAAASIEKKAVHRGFPD